MIKDMLEWLDAQANIEKRYPGSSAFALAAIYMRELSKENARLIKQRDELDAETKLVKSRSSATLAACPIGLFMSGDELCLKTEYGNNEGRIDAYIVSSGEMYWGLPPQTIESQRGSIVIPIMIMEDEE